MVKDFVEREAQETERGQAGGSSGDSSYQGEPHC